MTFKNVTLKDLKPNPMRDLRVDPLDTDRVEVLRNSVDVFGFRSGGVVARNHKNPETGEYELQIAAGHTRVAGAMKGGIKEAVIEVVPMTNTEMARWYVQENVSQRGQSPTAGPGAIIAAVRILAPLIMRGDLDGLKVVSREITTNDIAKMQGNIASEKGIGEPLISTFYSGVEGFTKNQIKDYLEIVKATGAYQRTIREIADVIEAEDAEKEKVRQKAAKEAEAKAKPTTGAKPKSTAVTTTTTKPKERTPTTTARGAREATKATAPTLNEKVAALFENKNQVRVFFKVVKAIGPDVLPVSEQPGLAKTIIKMANDEDAQLSETFIRERIYGLYFRGKRNAARDAKREEEDQRQARINTVALQRDEYMHNIFRDMQRIVVQGGKLRDLIKENPDVLIEISAGRMRDLERMMEFCDRLLKDAKGSDVKSKNVVTLHPRLTKESA